MPVGYLTFATDNPARTMGQMQDEALNKVRPMFATLPGGSDPPHFGCSARTIVINVVLDRLRARGFSPDEVVLENILPCPIICLNEDSDRRR